MHIFFYFFLLQLISVSLFLAHGGDGDLGLYKPDMDVADCCPA
jgi:hypothetical protein